MIRTTVVGGYPKTIGDQKLRRALREADRQGPGALDQTYKEVTRLTIEEQAGLGLDLVSDGCVRWDDEVTYLAKGLAGVTVNGLVRYFDTNVYYRKPIAQGKVSWKAPVLVSDFQFASSCSPVPIKVIVTGPFTLSKLSSAPAYPREDDFLEDLSTSLNAELLTLQAQGVKFLHVNEPAILQFPEEMPRFQRAMKRLFEGIRASTTLYFYFGDATPVLNDLLDFPVEEVGFDFTYTPDAARLLKGRSLDRRFLAGIMDARNTRLESRDEIFQALEQILTAVKPGSLSVAPSANLEFLPLDRCRNKVRNLVTLVREFEGVKG
ncbi:MAG: hypothetical protein HYY65_02050 [Candidatus Tectomicrobia bacterium]|uniref:Cobalamin-independent methionine synthase MetE C-terminal/archaeal domain-containing protein n=1 Tax=Tectimicrobiota bacterium TaxID=2528274 RepID=A0A932GMN4_UNCTE|nr:hypothetical protein [Candidatus Tectomicrobia bacterium]